MERGYLKGNVQGYNLPLDWLIVFQLGDFDHMQVILGNIKEMQEGLPGGKIILLLNQEGFFTKIPVCT